MLILGRLLKHDIACSEGGHVVLCESIVKYVGTVKGQRQTNENSITGKVQKSGPFERNPATTTKMTKDCKSEVKQVDFLQSWYPKRKQKQRSGDSNGSI